LTASNIIRVVLWMTGSLLSFCTMAIAIRVVADRLNVFEILTIRSGSGLAVILAIAALRADLRATITARSLWLHGLRNSVHFASQYGWALSLTLLPLATVFALEFTSPAWVAVLAIPLLGERMTVGRAGSIVLGFVGVLIIMRPGSETFQPAAVLVLAAAVGFAITFITTKKLTGFASTFAILFWMNVMQLPMGLIGSDPLFLARVEWTHVPAVIAIGFTGLSAHFCFTNALRHGDASVVVPLDFLRIPLIAFVGAALYAEPLDAFVFLGAAIIAAGVLWNLRAEAGR
jgi:drug/metabolite transporter (DMT)-like permease